MNYIPRRGDIVWIDMQPNAGHEQSGRRPALVVSSEVYHMFTNLAILCPITHTVREFPLHLSLDARTRIQGEIKCEQVKALDFQARNAEFIEKAPQDIVDKALGIIRLFFE